MKILLFSFRFWLISVFTVINQSSKFRSSETKNKSRKKLERSKESQVKQMFQISAVVRWIEKKKRKSNKKQRDAVALWETTMWHTVYNISYRTSSTFIIKLWRCKSCTFWNANFHFYFGIFFQMPFENLMIFFVYPNKCQTLWYETILHNKQNNKKISLSPFFSSICTIDHNLGVTKANET